MIKLNDIYEDYVSLSDINTDNVTVDDIAKSDEINRNLIKDIELAAKNAKLNVKITHAKTGHRTHTSKGYISRHQKGNAVDINTIDGYSGNNPKFKERADKLVDELKKLGYQHSTSESGKDKVVIWNSPNHYSHVHISNRSETPSTYKSSDTEKDDSTNPLNIFSKLLGKTLGVKVNEDIQRIKKLLK